MVSPRLTVACGTLFSLTVATGQPFGAESKAS